MKRKICYITIILAFLNTAFSQYSNNSTNADPLSETALYPVPQEMTFEEYQDMNRRMSQALLWSSIPIPGITHYYAGDIKKAKRLFYIGASGLACIVAGAFSLGESKWPEDRENYFIQNLDQDNEKWFEKIPVSVDISESGEEVIHYRLKEIQKESDGGGGFLMFAGAAIILGDLVYDRIVGLRLIEQKRDRVRYKYGRNLNFSFKTNLNPLKQNFGFGLSFYFG